jgi:hypothetical protein
MVRALTMFLVPRHLLCWVVAHLMEWCFGITPESVKHLRETNEVLRAARNQAVEERAVEEAKHAGTMRALAHAKTSYAKVVHIACKYRKALKEVEATKSHGRAVLIAKDAVKR